MQVSCTKCSYKKELYTGGGLGDCKLRTILAALDENGRKLLADEINRGAKYVSITRKLSVCDVCSTIQALPVVSYTLDGNEKKIFGSCSQCGKAGDVLRQELDGARCPECGASVTIQQVGNWD